MPFISVIVPTFNRAHCIRSAVDSILSQSFKDFELLVVDDGSTDETASALRPYGSRLRYLSQANSGACAARNTGIRAAKGKWIAFLDSDDEWLPEKLAVQVADIRRNPGIVLHTTNATLISENGESLALFNVTDYSAHDDSFDVIMRPLRHQIQFGLARLQCMIVEKKALLSAGMFDEANPLPLYEDQDLACRLALEGSWFVSKRCLARICRRPRIQDNLSRLRIQDPLRNAQCLVSVYGKLISDPRLTRTEAHFLRKILSAYEGMLGMELLRAGNAKKAKEVFL